MDQLYDSSGKIVAVGAFFMSLCIVLASLRFWVRWRTSLFAIDDYLFLAGLILWIISTSFVFAGCWNGLGAHVGRYTEEQAIVALRSFFFFEDFYVWANIPIKASICMTLIKISNQKLISAALYCLIFIVFGASVGTNVYLLTACTPLEATWNTAVVGASCRPSTGTVTLGNAYSAIIIFVDWTVALLPIFLLWKVQMAWKQKLSVLGILALGVFASTATVVRLGYLVNFTDETDYLYAVGPIVMWSVVELGLALVAGSLITLRPLFRRWFTSMVSSNGGRQTHSGFKSKSSGVARNTFVRTSSHDSNIGLDTIVDGGARDQKDADSQTSIIDNNNNNGIKVTRTFQMS